MNRDTTAVGCSTRLDRTHHRRLHLVPHAAQLHCRKNLDVVIALGSLFDQLFEHQRSLLNRRVDLVVMGKLDNHFAGGSCDTGIADEAQGQGGEDQCRQSCHKNLLFPWYRLHLLSSFTVFFVC